MSRRGAVEVGLALATGLAGLGLLQLLAPDYLSLRGFPLDDAWIHAVYGREFARTGTLAFNPESPATGATSPLWALLLALPHWAFDSLAARVFAIKLLGFAFQLITVACVFALFARIAAPARWIATAIVALHPDLIAASVSGMEVPLATALAVGMALCVGQGRPVALAVSTGLAFLGRPELVLFAFALPLLYATADRRRETLRLMVGAGVGLAAAAGPLFLRHHIVSGMPLPATFYAKVGALEMSLPTAELLGFLRLFGTISLLDATLLGLGAAALAGFCLQRRVRAAQPLPTESEALAAAMWFAGAAFCAVSFALIPPHDWSAFYHQRYVLPALPFLIAPLPVLAAPLVRRLPRELGAWVGGGAVAVLAGGLLVASAHRYPRLDNDARNVDDMNVRIGEQLQDLGPEQVVWVTDAGAIRYFGGATVVDLKGLNTPEMLGAGRDGYLAAHAPSFIQVMPIWMRMDPALREQMPALLIEPSTEYTVTGFSAMRQMFLVSCPESLAGSFELDEEPIAFRCASG